MVAEEIYKLKEAKDNLQLKIQQYLNNEIENFKIENGYPISSIFVNSIDTSTNQDKTMVVRVQLEINI